MYIDEATEKENMLLGRDPANLKDNELKAKYWRLRNEQDE